MSQLRIRDRVDTIKRKRKEKETKLTSLFHIKITKKKKEYKV